MSAEELLSDDQSHYEVSLTAGQAFLAFVLLLLSLAASFAFGLMIGRGRTDDRLLTRKEAAVVTEAPPAADAADKSDRIVEIGSTEDEFQSETPIPAPEPKARRATPALKITEEASPVVTAAAPAPVPARSAGVPFHAQLFSSSDQKAAEGMAAKLIDGGFSSAYVERGTSPKGPVFRVRVRFGSESEARAAEPKLRTFSKDVWITKQ